ncbi:MAG: hypothetical protein ACTSQW_09050 [Promethearchaeota archaeon]
MRRQIFLNYNSESLQKEEFQQHLLWYEAEFDEIFQFKSEKLTKFEKNIANSLLNKLSESINQCQDETLLYDLVSTLNNIEKKHPELF